MCTNINTSASVCVIRFVFEYRGCKNVHQSVYSSVFSRHLISLAFEFKDDNVILMFFICIS